MSILDRLDHAAPVVLTSTARNAASQRHRRRRPGAAWPSSPGRSGRARFAFAVGVVGGAPPPSPQGVFI